ncbi:MAG TPA: DUF4870 domain-containing protein [Flavobacterium sp.]|jgi:hypothetical protein
MNTTSHHNTATLIHLSALSQYFIPFGNFIFPIILWSGAKESSAYVDAQGKETINFQLSLFIYSIIMALIAIPVLFILFFKNVKPENFNYHGTFTGHDFNFESMTGFIAVAVITVFIFCMMKIAEFFLIIYAAVKTSGGTDFKYPLTIRFLK